MTLGSGNNHQGNAWLATGADKTNLTNWINQGALPNRNAPTVSSLSVTGGTASGGTAVTITGTAFGGTGTYVPVVTFGGVAATSVVVTTGSFTKITCVTPAHAPGPVNVIVSTTAGGASAPLANGFTYAAGAPAQLAFANQPPNTGAATVLSPAVTVQIQDASGNLTTSTANVTLALGANPGGSTLSGTATVAAVAGVATFSNLSLNRAGIGYTLAASSGVLTGATSSPFTITGQVPTITTPTSAAVATTTATLGGNASADGGATISARGVVFALTSVNNAPAIGGNGVTNMAAAAGGTGVFTVNATSLTPGTAYTFAAYATNSAGTTYTTAGSFTTVSNNANLASLVPGSGSLSPAFDPATTSYTLSVPYAVTSLSVTQTTAAGTATVNVNGGAVVSGTASSAINLTVGINTITTVVTAQDSSTKSYTLVVTRAVASSNASLASLVPGAGSLLPTFDSATITYSLSVPYTTSSLSVTPTTADSTATVQVNGLTVVSGSASGAISLNEGANMVTTIVTAQDGSTKTYSLTVNRALGGTISTLASLVPSIGTLSPVFASDTLNYTLRVPLATASITVTPTLTISAATVQINGTPVADTTASTAIPLNLGSNVINAVVTSADSSTMSTYVVTVTRAASSNADLASLKPDSGTLSPAFDGGTTGYTLDLPYATKTLSVTPAVADSNATLKVNSLALSSGTASPSVTLVEGDNTVLVTVTAQDSTVKNYTVVAHRAFSGAPRIAEQPAPRTVSPGTGVTFNVSAVGSSTLAYQWRKNGVKITPATSSSYTINSAQAADAGAYSVVVTNSLGTVTSDAAALTVAKAGVAGLPQITTQPGSLLVPLGQAANFSATAAGTATLTAQWLKGAAAIPLAVTTSAAPPVTVAYTTPATTLASAGIYSLQAKNSVGTVLSEGARLGVVSIATQTLLAKAGSTATLTVSAAGDGLLYHWKKDGVEISDSSSGTHIVSGTGAASLVIKVASLTDTGAYTCVVRMGALSLESGATALKVYDKAPVIQLAAGSTLPAGIVSGSYNDGAGHPYAVPVDPGADHSVVSFSAAGLPAGLKIDPVTGIISGKPTIASPAGKPFSVTLTATNAVSKTSVAVLLAISPLPAGAVGTFNGLVDRDASPANGLSADKTKTSSFGGSLNVASLSTGGFSGKLTLGTLSYPFVSQFLDAAIGADPRATVLIPRVSPLHNLTLTFVIKSTGELDGSVTDGVAPAVNVQAWRHTAPAAALIGSYTAAIDLKPGQTPDPIGDLTYPQGYGFGTLVVSATGAVWTGQLADGTPIATSTTIGSTGQIALHFMLYTAVGSNPGSAHGWLQVAADSLNSPVNAGLPVIDATMDWVKPAQPAASTNHNYKAGFLLHQLTMAGGLYLKPTTTVLGIQDLGLGTVDARLAFSDGGLTGPAPIVGASLAAQLNNTLFRISTANALFLPVGPVANPATLSLALTASSGALSGKFVLKDPDPTVHTGTVPTLTRTVSFAGLLVPRANVTPGVALNKGVGYFLLSKLPQDATANTPKTTLVTSDILSGQVVLGPK